MQFYDTPKSLKEAAYFAQTGQEFPGNSKSGPFANYDVPKEGPPMPVFRKPCGCIMKLVKQSQGRC